MAREFEVKTRLTAQDDASSTLSKVEKSFGSLAETIASKFVITAGDAERAVRALVEVLTDSIGAAADQQDAVARLSSALSNLGPGAAAGAGALRDLADAVQRTTRFSDDAVISAEAMLATFGVAPDKIGKATQASVDLAAALGIDLENAAAQVGATFNGVTGRLTRLVPELANLSEEALRSGAAVDLLATRLAGRAAAAADTFTGKLEILKNALGEVEETIGGTVVESETVSTALDAATVSTQGWNAALQVTIPALFSAFARLSGMAQVLDGVSRAWKFLTQSEAEAAREAEASAKKIAEAMQTEFDKVGKGIGLVVNALGALADGFAAITPATDFAKLMEHLARVTADTGNNISASAGIAREFGITLESSLNAQLTNTANKLATIEESFRHGDISARDYQVIVKALADEHERLEVALNGTAGAIDGLGTSADGASNAAETLRGRLAGLETQADSTTRALAFTSQAFDNMRRAAGSQAAVEAAVAAGGRLILGGTRVLIPGGGSRLTEPFPPGSINGGKFGG